MRIEGGGDLNTATRAKFEHCTWGENGRWGAVYADPGANLIDTIMFDQCVIYGNSRRLFVAEANVMAQAAG